MMKMIISNVIKIVLCCMIVLFLFTTSNRNLIYMGKVLFYPICRELSKENYIWDNSDYNVLETDNFSIYYNKYTDEDNLKTIEYSAEKNLKCMFRDFNYKPDRKINIIIYPEYEEMANKMKLGNGCIAVGTYYSGIISMLDLKYYKGSRVNIDCILLHELTHYTIDYMAEGNFPVWFTEGLALYEEYKEYNQKWAYNREYSNYYSVKELQGEFYRLDEVKAYKQSFLIIKYIVDSYGMDAIDNMIEQLSIGKSIDHVVLNNLNIDIKELFKRSIEMKI